MFGEVGAKLVPKHEDPRQSSQFPAGKGVSCALCLPLKIQAREHIDQALEQAGWQVQDYKSANLHAGRGVAVSGVHRFFWNRGGTEDGGGGAGAGDDPPP